MAIKRFPLKTQGKMALSIIIVIIITKIKNNIIYGKGDYSF